MINIHVLKKYSAFVITGVLPTSIFMMFLIPYGLNTAMIGAGLSVILCIFISDWLLSHPFRKMMEGKGLLTIMMSSKGVLALKILGLSNDKIVGIINGKSVDVKYENNLIHTLPVPTQGETYKLIKDDKTGKEYMLISQDNFRQYRFGFEQYPVLIYNEITGQLLTKEFLGDSEKQLMSHLIFNANDTAKQLNKSVLAFSRTVVDKEREGQGFDWRILMFWFIGIVIVMFIGYMLYKTFMSGDGGSVIAPIKSVISPLGG